MKLNEVKETEVNKVNKVNKVNILKAPEPRQEKAETLVLENIGSEFKPIPETGRNNKRNNNKVSSVPKRESGDVNYCSDETEDCYLTKYEMCQTIVKHMTIRNHLIAAILSVVPMDENGEKSFVSQRLKSLQKGMFLPPKDKISPENNLEERIRTINQYVKFKNINKEECEKSLGGVFKELTEGQFNELKNDNDEIS